MTVTNPSLDQPREVEIGLRGASIGSGKVVTLAAADAHAHNSFENPHAVEPREENLQANGSKLTRVSRRPRLLSWSSLWDNMLKELREQVLEANLELVRRGLVLYTFGNASGIARAEGLVAIKPSGVPYEGMRPDDLVITDLDGRIVEGTLRPSSDLATHLVLYRSFPSIGGVVHTHSRFATAWAQARRPIPCLGTTHADYFRGSVPVTRAMAAAEIEAAYEANTGEVIARHFRPGDPWKCPRCWWRGTGHFVGELPQPKRPITP